jgi:ABC-type lipoprotein export system ATPase subunit
MGLSGSGKSTLLGMLGGLIPVDKLREDARLIVNFRRNGSIEPHDLAAAPFGVSLADFGFVFQEPHLLKNATGLTNMMVPLTASGHSKTFSEIDRLLADLNLTTDKLSNRARQLSGGEKQRTAVARSVLRNPQIILADEPTANLDAENGLHLMSSLVRWQRERRDARTIVWVTHNLLEASVFADHIVVLAVTRNADAEERALNPVGRLLPGYDWPIANSHDPESLSQFLFKVRVENRLALRSGHIDALRMRFVDGTNVLATKPDPAPTAATGDPLQVSGGSTPSRRTILQIATSELFSAGRADMRHPPRFFAILIGKAPRHLRAPTNIAWRIFKLLLLVASVGLILAPSSPELLAQLPPGIGGAAADFARLTGSVLVLLALARSIQSLLANLGWGIAAFGKWHQVAIFLFICIFIYLLVLARDALDGRFVTSLKGLELGHVVLTERLGGKKLDDRLIAEHGEKLAEHLKGPLAAMRFSRLRSYVVDPLRALFARLGGWLLPDILRVSPASTGSAPANTSQRPWSIFGRWSHSKLSVGRRVGQSLESEVACPSQGGAPSGQADVLAISVDPIPEPVLSVMQYLDVEVTGDLINLRRIKPTRLEWQDGNGIFGVLVTPELFKFGLQYLSRDDLNSGERVDRYFCLDLYSGRYLVHAIGIVEKTPKEELVERYDVLVPHALHQHAHASRPGYAGDKIDYYNTEALYVEEPKLISEYRSFLEDLGAGRTTILPDAFRQISKGLETSDELTRLSTAIVYGVILFAGLIVGMIAYSFIRENEKSLCVMRAFSVRQYHVVWLVMFQILGVWLIALLVALCLVQVSNTPLLMWLADALEVKVAVLGSPRVDWMEYALTFTAILCSACWVTVLYWWYKTDAVGERLKQLE